MNGRTAHTDIDRLSAEEKVEDGVSAETVHICRAGIDIGSTTVKLAILDQDGELDPTLPTEYSNFNYSFVIDNASLQVLLPVAE